MPDKKPVGGRRSYQPGRPHKPKAERHRRIAFSVPPDVAEWLMALEHRSEWLTTVVRSQVRSEPTSTAQNAAQEGATEAK